MDQCEDREEGVPPPESPVWGKHESWSKAQRKRSGSEMDHRAKRKRKSGAEPEPSCVSVKSDMSNDFLLNFKSSERPAEQRTDLEAEPEPSSVSFRSDKSNDFTDDVKPPAEGVERQRSEVPGAQAAQQQSTTLDSTFMELKGKMFSFVEEELKKNQDILSQDKLEWSRSLWEDGESDDEGLRTSKEALMKIAVYFLKKMKREDLVERLQSKHLAPGCQYEVKSSLKKKFQRVFEGIPGAGKSTLLNQIYTELYITEGGTDEVSDEHEVRQIEIASRKADGAETRINKEDLFKDRLDTSEPVKTVITKGGAGIGKTVLTQKVTLDWAEDRAYKNIQFIFPFTFRELNVLKENFSLMELVRYFFAETKEISSFEEFKLLFIFDGLDECRLPLDFQNNKILTDVSVSTSVDVLLTNLIKGNLLPSARLWITTRPAAASKMPPECVTMVTELRGFTDLQKEEYFRRRFTDKEQAKRIISHIQTSQSLNIMCHIPVFCWITASVLEDVIKTKEEGELPQTLTELYIHFLVVQTKVKNVKYDRGSGTDSTWSAESRKMIRSLGKLAFEKLQKGNLIFYESDLKECGINIKAASVYSGVFTQIFKEERGLYQDVVYCFVHLSVQEFLAALYVHQTFIEYDINLLEEESQQTNSDESEADLNHLHQCAVDKALKSKNGQLDLFLRFLLGLSLQNNRKLLRGLLTQTGSGSQSYPATIEYIKKKISEDLPEEQTINLFHCLKELNDHSLEQEIQNSLRKGSLSTDKLSPAQWSALAFILMSSRTDLEVFDLKKYTASEEALLRLLPVVKVSNKALLSSCELSDRSCEVLSSALSSKTCSLRDLDLWITNSGVNRLSVGLKSPQCKLKTLRLRVCALSEGNVAAVSSFVSSESFSLRELHLSHSYLKGSEINLLSKITESPKCELESLSLTSCDLSEKSCEVLSKVLRSKSSSLRELDLSNNDLKDSGVKLLSAALRSSDSQLEKLRLSGCLITAEGCASLAAVLSSKSSKLKELDLSYNHPGDSGWKLLSECGLQTLSMEPAGVRWLTPGLKKYSSIFTIDMNTVHRKLKLSDNNRRVTYVKEDQSYQDHEERFDIPQLLYKNELKDRCYWEVEWRGDVYVSVSYKGIKRKGDGKDCVFGENDQSWSLDCSESQYLVWHNNRKTPVTSTVSHRVAVYVDVPAGILSFYRVSYDKLIHLHTFNTTFTQRLYPGFYFWSPGSSVLSVKVSLKSDTNH